MVVVTISNWRRKIVWLLAAVLVAVVLLGQLAAGGHSNLAREDNPPPGIQRQEQPAATSAVQDSGLEGLLEKLRSFYRGE
ncbi:hypothetical protein [Neomoorella thermoacetica]|uniref:Uncharacterized protein n=2 Tax=Neomoorella thermoacetica TaxID=1525 RepID=A0A1D7XBE0_NEOTH|nr:hypothetical protein [Moorella thermoacetica]AKX94285.1 hypothetical protein MOTHE_c14920 [Moorella thermoacetica]AKX96923.1 hypothetical protein MOTHA_c15770 [Moorella thermoacetica]AOQ24233.1 hypothetical protein Maut_01796 [Moorella thermoacetica]OIQ11040.1 hypothetical protein MOOTH_20580 [Moorella thermoacetica]OIQ54398.1 hypothetical protein MORE_13670 [Moorella thermoacetica]